MKYKAKPFTAKAFEEALRNFDGRGTAMEFGIRWGRSFVWFAQRIYESYPKCYLVGFDSWRGLPEEAKGLIVHRKHAPGRYKELRFKTEQALHDLDVFTKRVSLVDGWFSDTLTDDLKKTIHNPVCFVHLDCDLYISTIQVLRWLESIVSPGTILVFDDLKKPIHSDWGQRKALNEWTKETRWKCEKHGDGKVFVIS